MFQLRIRRGKIRILIDDGSGNQVPVGPIQLSSADSIEELQQRVSLANIFLNQQLVDLCAWILASSEICDVRRLEILLQAEVCLASNQ